jgi:nucleotide-binding universal stress UspA family protein
VSATIVVGVDGSNGGEAALEFAAREAAFRGARLVIVSAWQVPVVPAHTRDFGPPLDAETWDAFSVRAQQIADDALAAAKRMQPDLDGEAVGALGRNGRAPCGALPSPTVSVRDPEAGSPRSASRGP